MPSPVASVGQALTAAKQELTDRMPSATALEQAETGGLGLYTRAVIGYQAPPGARDAPRLRLFTQVLPPPWAVRLLTEHAQGAFGCPARESGRMGPSEGVLPRPGRKALHPFRGS